MEDHSCATGSECVGTGCLSNRPALYSHIQLASPLLRHYNDDGEVAWRAANNDLIIGGAVVRADQLRAVNPNVRLFEYITARYYLYEADGAQWSSARGIDPEDFYLHYREDVYRADWANAVIVPGFPPGVVPGWNPNAGPGDPPASAITRDQSRAIGMQLGAPDPWYLANMSNRHYRAYLADFTRRLLNGDAVGANPAATLDGIAVDNAFYYAQFNEGMIDKTNEFYGIPMDEDHPYAEAHARFLVELRDALAVHFPAGIDVLPNYGHTWWMSYPDPNSGRTIQELSWAWGDVWLMYRDGSTPTGGALRVPTYEIDYQPNIVEMVRQTRKGGRRVLGARDLAGGSAGSDRGRLFTLALYYIVHNPNTYYEYHTTNVHVVTDISTWQANPAVTHDVGQPSAVPPGYVDFDGRAGTTEHYEFASGADPYDPTLTYHVLARRFTRGLALVKMLPQGSVTDDRSATTHPLDRAYAVLGADGTLGTVVNEITLRNNEGVILVSP